MTSNFPKRISFFWAQGEDEAPDIVKRCWQAWSDLNPSWSVEIFAGRRARSAIENAGISHVPATHAAQSDIFRIVDLQSNGGVYVDAATVPIRPLDEWLPDYVRQGFFAYHDPYRQRLVESWFIASTPHHQITSKWLGSIKQYWSVARRPQIRKRELDPTVKGILAHIVANSRCYFWNTRPNPKIYEPSAREWSVNPEGGARRPVYPYFWLHYLFGLLWLADRDFRESFALMPKVPSYKELMIRHWRGHYSMMTDADIRSLVEGSCMQKLALRSLPSSQSIEKIFNTSF